MQYRTMGRSGEELSALGYGCMRFPEKNRKIDRKRSRDQVYYALDRGVNYLDTGFMYHFGESEPFLGEILQGARRHKVKLATKLPPHAIKKASEMDVLLNNQLKRLRTDRIDYYLLHGLDERSWARLKGFEALGFLDRALADGRIVRPGFSFHGRLETFKEIVDSYDWHFCQIQYNYLDEYNQAGTEGLEYAAAKGLGVVVMEPLRGGSLGGPPKAVASVFQESKPGWSPAEWALRWVWNHPEVTVVLSGMNEESHIEENLRVAGEALPNSLTAEDLAVIDRVKSVYHDLLKIGCTACGYCLPCPAGVNIPMCFELYNRKKLFGDDKFECLVKYAAHLGGLDPEKSEKSYASKCEECGKCEKKCPQHLEIPKHLKAVEKEFETFIFKLLLLYGKYFFSSLKRRRR